MLKFARLFVMVASFATFLVLSSCSEDAEPSQSNIVGTWNISSYELGEITINGQPAITYLTTALGLNPQQAQLALNLFLAQLVDQNELENTTFTFNADGTYIIDDGDIDETGTYILRNNNTELVLTSVNGTDDFDVLELTANRLRLLLEDSEDLDIEGDGTDEEIEFSIQATLVK